MSHTTKKPIFINLASLALDYARPEEGATRCKHVLKGCYQAWFKASGKQWTVVEVHSREWKTRMQGMASEYQAQKKAKHRELQLRAKLLALSDKVEGA